MDNKDDLILVFPMEPLAISAKVIPKIIQMLAEVFHLEAVMSRRTDQNGVELCFLRANRPSNWNDESVRKFVTKVCQFASQEAKKVMEQNEN